MGWHRPRTTCSFTYSFTHSFIHPLSFPEASWEILPTQWGTVPWGWVLQQRKELSSSTSLPFVKGGQSRLLSPQQGSQGRWGFEVAGDRESAPTSIHKTVNVLAYYLGKPRIKTECDLTRLIKYVCPLCCSLQNLITSSAKRFFFSWKQSK